MPALIFGVLVYGTILFTLFTWFFILPDERPEQRAVAEGRLGRAEAGLEELKTLARMGAPHRTPPAA